MSRDTLNGTLVSRFADFTGVSWSSALPQFVKTERSGATDLACSQIGTFGTTSSIILCEFLLAFRWRLELRPAIVLARRSVVVTAIAVIVRTTIAALAQENGTPPLMDSSVRP